MRNVYFREMCGVEYDVNKISDSISRWFGHGKRWMIVGLVDKQW